MQAKAAVGKLVPLVKHMFGFQLISQTCFQLLSHTCFRFVICQLVVTLVHQLPYLG